MKMNPCYLCDTEAFMKRIHPGNRLMVQCPNSNCGHYEISDIAIEELKKHPGKGAVMQIFVNQKITSGKIVEILYDIVKNDVIAQVKKSEKK